MGERIRDLKTDKIIGAELRIELNKGQTQKDNYDIHIETGHLRFNMSDKEFMKLVAVMIEAKRKLLDNKEIKG